VAAAGHGSSPLEATEGQPMGEHLVLVGGGHAHLTALLRLSDYVERGHRVTLISPCEYQYYSGMGPGMLGGTYRPQQARFHIAKMARERRASFVEDRVVRIAAADRAVLLSSGQTVSYDIASFNTGSEVAAGDLLPEERERVFAVKPVVNLLKARDLILAGVAAGRPPRVVVVGGGPAGVEVAAGVWRLLRQAGALGNIALVAGRRLLAAFPDRARELALRSFSDRGVEVIEGTTARDLQDGIAVLSVGKRLPYDVAFVATGIRPSPIFQGSGLVMGRDGALLVNACLQSVSHPEVFGGGDCIDLEGAHLAKVGVYAVRENHILHHNLLAALEGRRLRRFDPGSIYLLILNMGDGRGILTRGGWVWDGRFAFSLKDYLDRRFMRRFQVSGELDEPPAQVQ